jgi:hypothetical protein
MFHRDMEGGIGPPQIPSSSVSRSLFPIIKEHCQDRETLLWVGDES